MKLLHLRKPSPAMVIACISLLVALSGASYAAVKLPRNSVGTPQLKKNAVVSAKVRNGTLKAIDFATGQLPKGDKGDPGPTAGFGSGNPIANPSSTPEGTVGVTHIVSLPSPGRLLVLGRFTRSVQCSTPSVRFGLYVDGSAISGSAMVSAAGAGEPLRPFSLEGVTGALTAGAHSLTIQFDCLSGTAQDVDGPEDEAITAVLLGS